MICDSVLVRVVYVVRRSAGNVQQLLQSGTFALEALKLLQVGSRGEGSSLYKLHGVDVRGN